MLCALPLGSPEAALPFSPRRRRWHRRLAESFQHPLAHEVQACVAKVQQRLASKGKKIKRGPCHVVPAPGIKIPISAWHRAAQHIPWVLSQRTPGSCGCWHLGPVGLAQSREHPWQIVHRLASAWLSAPLLFFFFCLCGSRERGEADAREINLPPRFASLPGRLI